MLRAGGAMLLFAAVPAWAGASATVRGDFELLAVGDLLYSHPFAGYPDPKLQRVLSLLRRADVVIGNKEGVFFDLRAFSGTRNDGGLLWGEPALGTDMKAVGVDMVSVANNHSMDWGWRGLEDSMQLLDAAGVVHAGAGPDLRTAREAGILRTPKGVVALVATASTFTPNADAEDPFADLPGRPGISALHVRKVNLVTRSQMAMIRRLATQRASLYEPAPAPHASELYFGGEPYRVSSHPGLHYEMDAGDLAGLLRAVRAAKRSASLVIFTIHAHETATGEDDDNPTPPDFLIELAHDVIDAGADVFVGTGIHDLRGIEIYEGRPVFYGMSSFFINGELKASRPSRRKTNGPGECFQVRPHGDPKSWFDSMAAVVDFERGDPKTVKIYPLDLGDTCNQSRRGIPHFATPAAARRILLELQRYSAPFGTRITVKGQVGAIRISRAIPDQAASRRLLRLLQRRHRNYVLAPFGKCRLASLH